MSSSVQQSLLLLPLRKAETGAMTGEIVTRLSFVTTNVIRTFRQRLEHTLEA